MKYTLLFLFSFGLLLSTKAQSINIFGVVLDEVSGNPVVAAKVFFQNEAGKIIYEGATNENGYFNLNTKLTPGREIFIDIRKSGYRLFNRKYFIKDRDNGLEITLTKLQVFHPPKTPERGEIVKPGIEKPIPPPSIWQKYISGYVYTMKKGIPEPLKHVAIEFEVNGKRYNQMKISSNEHGYYIIYFNFKNGQEINVYFEHEEYKLARERHIYIAPDSDRNSQNKVPNVYLKKKPKTSISLISLISAGGVLAGSGTLGVLSSSKYNNHKEFTNYSDETEWLQDLDRSNNLRKTSGYLLIGGVAILAGWGTYKLFFEEKDADLSDFWDRHTSLTPTFNYNASSQSLELGFRLNF